MSWKALSALVLVAVVAGGGWYYVQNMKNDADEQIVDKVVPVTVPDKTVKETLAVEGEEDYPQQAESAVAPPKSIDGSDETVRQAAADLSEPLSSWLSPQHQLRKWVAMVDQMAVFKLPNKNLPVSFPRAGFKVVETGNGLQNDPANFKRWNPLINTVTSLDPKRVAVYYKKWSPLLESTYSELGNPQSFDSQFRTTIEHLLSVEPIPANVALRHPKVFYEYADPVLENADSLSKWLWRLGPDNMRKLQAWLRDVSSYL